ncbi:Molybdate transporter 2 [Lecanosticta acicola]|uniref:Molybdate transporter 2 n=1 Tax=Lecanosticta acicola TaxID=111012 RepID=A0AAI8Z6J3_9PEZI|nr:Molybdate transporter 2 [Lecanosticta acicola]
MTFTSNLKSINRHNVHTLRTSPLAELSGALGDLGTLLPLMIAMALKGSINLSSTLVFSGLTNVFTGVFFGIPLPVQPMKAIAAVAISQNFTRGETAAAGLVMGAAVLVLSATGLLRWLHRVVPVAVVKGIQVGAGLSLVISAGASLIKPLDWISPAWDNRLWAIAAFIFLVVATLVPRIPYALVVFIFGLILAGTVIPGSKHDENLTAGLWHPDVLVPSGKDWKIGAIDAAIPQLPLTTLNSILAVTSLSASLFPSFPPTPSMTSVGFSVAIANLIACWFGAMPVCHGSGGLAGQYRFGARSGSSIIVLGLVKFLLGLFVGEAIIPLLQRFPKALLGIMVLAAGVELSKVGQSVGESRDLWEQAEEDNNEDGTPSQKARQATERESRDRWMVMLITVAGCLAFKNDAVGFLAGLVWHWGLRLPSLVERVKHGRGSIRLRHEGDERGQTLLGVNHDGPEGRTV